MTKRTTTRARNAPQDAPARAARLTMAAAARTSERVSGAANDATEGAASGAAAFGSLFGGLENREAMLRPAAETIDVMRDVAAVLTRTTQDFGREWAGLVQQGLRLNMEAAGAMARCRSVPDLLAVQAELLRGNLEQTSRAMHQLAAASTRLANETDIALTPLTAPGKAA
ncbi:MAG TPA: phasin family protein [Microvirga sp.]|jgi:hypothetical protein|nr:phasin family protein [Microvirga sp.]